MYFIGGGGEEEDERKGKKSGSQSPSFIHSPSIPVIPHVGWERRGRVQDAALKLCLICTESVGAVFHSLADILYPRENPICFSFLSSDESPLFYLPSSLSPPPQSLCRCPSTDEENGEEEEEEEGDRDDDIPKGG